MPYADRNRRLEYLREYRAANPDDRDRTNYKQRVKERQGDLVRAAKSGPCTDCNLTWPYYVMQFDHRPDEEKLFNISTYRSYVRSDKVLLAEIAKCDPVCANCHFIRTHERTHGTAGV